MKYLINPYTLENTIVGINHIDPEVVQDLVGYIGLKNFENGKYDIIICTVDDFNIKHYNVHEFKIFGEDHKISRKDSIVRILYSDTKIIFKPSDKKYEYFLLRHLENTNRLLDVIKRGNITEFTKIYHEYNCVSRRHFLDLLLVDHASSDIFKFLMARDSKELKQLQYSPNILEKAIDEKDIEMIKILDQFNPKSFTCDIEHTVKFLVELNKEFPLECRKLINYKKLIEDSYFKLCNYSIIHDNVEILNQLCLNHSSRNDFPVLDAVMMIMYDSRNIIKWYCQYFIQKYEKIEEDDLTIKICDLFFRDQGIINLVCSDNDELFRLIYSFIGKIAKDIILRLYKFCIMYNANKIISTIKELKLLDYVVKTIELTDIFAIASSGSIKSLEYICNEGFEVIDNINDKTKINDIITISNNIYASLQWIFVRNPQWIWKIDFCNMMVKSYLLGQLKIVRWIKQHQRKFYSKKMLYILRKIFHKIDDNVPNCILDYIWLGFEFKNEHLTFLQKQLLS